ADRRQGPGRLPGGARVPGGERAMSRLDALRALLEEPLIVTNPVNVRYLTGLQSSNAALAVEPDRVLLFVDFRYREAAAAVAGVEVVETARALYPDIGKTLSGRYAFEADHVTYAAYEAMRAGGVELVPRTGVVERLRAIKDEAEIDAIRRAAHAAD